MPKIFYRYDYYHRGQINRGWGIIKFFQAKWRKGESMRCHQKFYWIFIIIVLFSSCDNGKNPISYNEDSADSAVLSKINYISHYLTNSNDNYTGNWQHEQVFGLGGDDRILGMEGNDYLLGNAGRDWLYGNIGNDILRGGNGNDQMYGGQDDDQIWGDLGDDYMSGGYGNDTYCYRYGDGNDVIGDVGGIDRILLYNISRSDVWFAKSGNDLVIRFRSGSIVCRNHYLSAYAIERLEFANDNSVSFMTSSSNISITKIIYTALPLTINNKELLRITIAENSAVSKVRKFNVRVYAVRSYGTWQIAAADGVTLNPGQSSANFYFNVTFNTPGSFYTRVDVYDALSGTLLASRQGLYPDVIEDSDIKIVQNVPYFFQYNNSYNPGGSCQNTSMAMVLRYYGANVVPDNISNYYGTSLGQTPEGFQYIFNQEAAYFGLSVRDHASRYGRISDIKSEIDNGRPVIVHGYFTNYGHVLVVVGYDNQYYYCNDPAGKWSEIFKGGYISYGQTDGKYIKYRKSAFEYAVAPDGYVWIHKIY